MTALRHCKNFTNRELELLKQMYLSGESHNDIAVALKRTRLATSSAIGRMLRTKAIPIVRSTALISLGGIDAAQLALDAAKNRDAKKVIFLTKNGEYSNIPVTALEQHIARYKLAIHLLGATE